MAVRGVSLAAAVALLVLGAFAQPSGYETFTTSCADGTEVVIGSGQLIEAKENAATAKIFFGKYFRIDGEWALVGGYGAKNFKGTSYFFRKAQDGSWEYHSKVKDAAQSGGSYNGLYLGLSGTMACVSAPYHDTTVNKEGQAYIYDYDSGSDVWVETEKLQADPQALDPASLYTINTGYAFGYGIDCMSEAGLDTVVVGARGARDPNGKRVGGVWVYTRPNSSTPFTAIDLFWGDTSGAQFSDDIALSKDLMVISAPRHKNVVTNDRAFGAGYIYKRNAGTGRWAQEAKLQPDMTGTQFTGSKQHFWEGCASLVTSTGERWLVGGGERAASDIGEKTGSAFAWKYNSGTSTWDQKTGLFSLKVSSARMGQRLDFIELEDAPGTLFGCAGAWSEKAGTVKKAGVVYCYLKCAGTDDWTMHSKLWLADAAEEDQYGNMVAMDQGVLGVGAPKRDSGEGDPVPESRGGVYMYNFYVAGSTTTPTSTPSPVPTTPSPEPSTAPVPSTVPVPTIPSPEPSTAPVPSAP